MNYYSFTRFLLVSILIFSFSNLNLAQFELPSRYRNLPKTTLDYVNDSILILPEDQQNEALLKVEYLDCSSSVPSDKYLKTISKLILRTPNLKVLDMSDNYLSSFSKLKWEDNSSLRRIDLSNNRIKKISSKLLNKSINLEELNLSGNLISKVPMNKMGGLKTLDLSRNNIYWLEFKTPKDGTVNTTLQNLDVGYNPFLPSWIGEKFGNYFQSLRYVDISNTNLTTLDSTKFIFPNLETLILRECDFFQLSFLDPVKDHLKYIDISYTKGYSDSSNTTFSFLTSMSSLKGIALGGGIREGDYGQIINTIGSISNLDELHLKGENQNLISAISKLPNASKLQKISFDYCGLHAIPDISKFENLKYLSVKNNSLIGLPTKEELNNLSKLRELDVSVDTKHFRSLRIGTCVYESYDILYLLNSLPDTKIIYNNLNTNSIQEKKLKDMFLDVNSAWQEQSLLILTHYNTIKSEDPDFSITLLDAVNNIEENIDPCGDKRMLIELQTVIALESVVTTWEQNEDLQFAKYTVSTVGQIESLDTLKYTLSASDFENEAQRLDFSKANNEVQVESQDLILSRYYELHEEYKDCSFSNERAVGKVKSEIYSAIMGYAKKLEAEHEQNNARIQQLINRSGGAGAISAIGEGVAFASFNSNVSGIASLTSLGSQAVANSAENKALRLQERNQKLEEDIIKLKELANYYMK